MCWFLNNDFFVFDLLFLLFFGLGEQKGLLPLAIVLAFAGLSQVKHGLLAFLLL